VIARAPSSQPVPPPPLSRRQSTWRYLVAGLISLLTWLDIMGGQARDRPYLWWLDLFAGLVAFIAYGYRRRYPVPVVAGLTVLTSFSGLAAGPASLGLVSLATRRRPRELLLLAVLSLAAGSVYPLVYPDKNLPWLAGFVINVLITGVLIAIGMYIGARRELVVTRRARAEQAEAEQALRIAQARANERARIAREMHDVLAHRISLVAMHAGALGYRTNLTPQEMARVAEVIQDTAHQALADLRAVLGVLRSDEQRMQPERPQPTLGDLDGLIADERQAGARIHVCNRAKQIDEIPEAIGRTAYRILQESLTNARKHAPNTAVEILVAGRPGKTLILLVRNPLPVGANTVTPGAGLGLIGLAERAELSGGRLDHRITGGQFVVRSRLPWPGVSSP
jgi:signal transduction histidine kinase